MFGTVVREPPQCERAAPIRATATTGAGKMPPGVQVDRARAARLAHAHAVLERARAVVERGWVRGTSFVTTSPPPRGLRQLLRGSRSPEPGDIRAACLLGAVTVGAQQVGPGTDLLTTTGPAVDALWDALYAERGIAGAAVLGRSAPASVRAARMRELAQWNDQPARTRDDVLRLLDRAIGHASREG